LECGGNPDLSKKKPRLRRRRAIF